MSSYLRKVHAPKSTYCVQIVHLRIQLQIIIYKELCLAWPFILITNLSNWTHYQYQIFDKTDLCDVWVNLNLAH
jgi:hypothetical protein